MKLYCLTLILAISVLKADGFSTGKADTIAIHSPRGTKQTQMFSSILANDNANENLVTSDKNNSNLDDLEKKREAVKDSLLGLIGSNPSQSSNSKDPILADPITKQNLRLESSTTILFGGQKPLRGVKVNLISDDNKYSGRSDTYYDLLRSSSAEMKAQEGSTTSESSQVLSSAINSIRFFIPPPIRGLILPDENYIPMRDLFTSPQVSFLYERGWRQGFAAAGFPGADKEYELVRAFFKPIKPNSVVDMSCATGLFTRRLAKGGDYKRVIGCDYSDSMLTEARRRIENDPSLSSSSSSSTQLDLVRCDVGDLPMSTESVSALHAGAGKFGIAVDIEYLTFLRLCISMFTSS